MKKIFGVTFGGLQKKAVLLVLCMLALMVAMFLGVSYYQNRMLLDVVGNTRTEQQSAISQTSQQIIYQVLEQSQVGSTELRAGLADNDFAEVIHDVSMLRTMAQGILENRDALSPVMVSPPDPALEGKASAYVLHEDGVDYTKSELLGYVAHLTSPMVAMWENSDKIDSCYIGLADGTDLCVDEKPQAKYDPEGTLIPFPVRQRPWYTGAVAAGDISFTGVSRDAFTGSVLITCAAPVTANGELAGVVGVDIVLSSMKDFVGASSQGSYAYVVNQWGEVILSSGEGGPFQVELSGRAEDLRRSENPALSRFITQSLETSTGLTELTLGDKAYYMVGCPMPSVGWSVVSVVEKELTEQPGKQLLGEYDAINASATAQFQAGTANSRRMGWILLGIAVLICVLGAVIATKRMVRPIEQMTREIVGSAQTGAVFQMKDAYRTDDEMELLAEAFDDLSKKTVRYIDEITRITKETERVHTELQLANQIQESMLPSIFPPYPDREEFDLYASMDPAKEVGGDFYDFFLIDEDHLCLVIADVSGKGIPAALFMMISKVIVQSCAMLGQSAAEILTKTNEALCSNNQVDMFVTVWLGILEISTGTLRCSNAGHEYPVVKQPTGDFALVKDRHGLVIGGMEGVRYTEYTLNLEPGAKLFVYTDGVPEATDSENRLFGTDRMLEALNREPKASPRETLKNVRAAVDGFVGQAEQFDDLTMLCLEYKGKKAAPAKDPDR